MSKFEVTLHDRENTQDAKDILTGLAAYNVPFTGPRDYRELTINYRDPKTKELVGGLHGSSQWGWLFVKWLFVAESGRRHGLGRQLMADAEKEARARGCTGIWLDTFSFQAPGFYEKLGFTRFGEVKDYPGEHTRFFYSKKI